MLIYIVFLIIFVGVTTALYQVYETHYNINFGNEKKLPTFDKSCLKELSAQAEISKKTTERSDFDQAVTNNLGPEFDRDIALVAFAEEEKGAYAIPLLRRKDRLVFNVASGGVGLGDIKVRHLPFWKTKLPDMDVRGILIILIILNCFLVQLLGAMSVYTIGYEVSWPLLSWLNDPMIVVIAIYSLIFLTFFISKLDMYMNDIYQLGKLFKYKEIDENSVCRHCT